MRSSERQVGVKMDLTSAKEAELAQPDVILQLMGDVFGGAYLEVDVLRTTSGQRLVKHLSAAATLQTVNMCGRQDSSLTSTREVSRLTCQHVTLLVPA
jgi:hypothetical protein